MTACVPYPPLPRSKLDEVALAVTEAPIPYGYGPWLKMSPEGMEFIKVCVCASRALALRAE